MAGISLQDANADALSTLLRTISDGRPHALRELARGFERDGASDSLGAVLDRLVALQRDGMPLVVRDGVVRAKAFTPLAADAIERHLPSGHRWTIRVVPSTTSTNTELLVACRAARTIDGPTLLAAEVQRSGRGRSGRRWLSAPGASLTASFAVPIARPLSELDGVTLVCGLALHDVMRASGVRTRLKWPNDLLVDGEKLAGILVEAHAAGGRTVLVVGIGMNVTPIDWPADEQGSTALTATSLKACGLASVDRNALVALVAVALQERLVRFADDRFAAVADEWNALDAFRDRPVRLRGSAGTQMDGVARGVDQSGALLVDVEGVRHRIAVGDVSLRSQTQTSLAGA